MPEPPAPPEPLRLEVLAESPDPAVESALRPALASHPLIRSQYPNADLWLLGVDSYEKEEGPYQPFRAILEDQAGSAVVEVDGSLDDFGVMTVIPTSRPRLPNDEEHAWALDVLRTDEEIARRLDAGELEAYRPMPPLANRQDVDGSVDRVVTIGLRVVGDTAGDEPRHRILALRTKDGEILADPPGVPSPSDRDCGLPDGASSPPVAGEPQAGVRVWRGEELLWDLVVARPSASSGANGSGVELRNVRYQRASVLHRAHVPILNVAYDGDSAVGGCGPTARAWLNEESGFEAEGEEPVPGFRVCASPARSILERGEGGGDFRGVALWVDGDELVVLSQLQAGWYRYVSEWRLGADGTIQPRMGFSAVRNPCTCLPHTHHAYWRFDFDILTSDQNLVQEYNQPPLPGQLSLWQTVRLEVARRRDPERDRRWRVRTTRSSHGYTLVPGPDDGVADEYGAGDVWILAHNGWEVDDAQGFTTDPLLSRAQLDRFVSGELVERQDVVLWYAAHVRDAPAAGPGGEAVRAGPRLEPFNWKPPADQAPYPPLVPPPMPDPDEDDDGDDGDVGAPVTGDTPPGV